VLGIEVLQRKDHILLSQKAYIQRLLKKHNMEDCNGVRTPMSPSQKLTRNPDGEPADETTYRSIIGGLAFVMTCTRPDIAFAVSKLSRYLNAPTKDHMQAALHLLRYLKHTMEFCLHYPRDGGRKWNIYVDADHGGCLDTRRSTSGRLIFYNGCLISWKSKRQTVVAKSTAEAEHIALSDAVTDGIWLKNLAKEIGIDFNDATIHEDNIPCLQIAKNPIITQRTKGIDISYHHAREHIQNGTFNLQRIGSTEQTADMLTKPLSPATLTPFVDKIFARHR